MRKSLLEMPHIETVDGVIDLRVEKYPVSNDEKRNILQHIKLGGIVGFSILNGKWNYFDINSTRIASEVEVKTLPHLPEDWEDYFIKL